MVKIFVEKMVKIFVEKTFGFWVGEKGAPIPGALSILGVHYEYTQTQCEEGARVVDNIWVTEVIKKIDGINWDVRSLFS